MRSPLEINERKKIISGREAIEGEECIIVKYKLTPTVGISLEEAAARSLIISTLRTMKRLSYEGIDERLKNAGRVISVSNTNSNNSGLVEMAFPINSCSEREGITHLITLITTAAEYNYTQSFWVDSIELPKSFLQRYKGPRFGCDGIRKIFNVNRRPLIGLVVKPRIGATIESIITTCKEALLGGVDFLVDDLLLVDPDGEMSFKNRVARFVNLCNQLTDYTRQQKKYFVNISLNPTTAIDYAHQAADIGAGAILVNSFSMGLGSIEYITNNLDGKLPVICTNMGSGIMTRGSLLGDPNVMPTGMSEAVFAKLSRIVGADCVHTGTSASECYGEDAWGPASNALKYKLHGIKPSMAVAEGDLNIVNLWDNIKSLENDLLVEPTSGIINYPGGTRKGAEAFRLLVDNLDSDMSDTEAHELIQKLASKNVDLKKGLTEFNYSPINR